MINKYLTEMHLHTKETSNCGKMPAAETVESYISLGYNTIVVTDHFSTHTYYKYNYNFTIFDFVCKRITGYLSLALFVCDRIIFF